MIGAHLQHGDCSGFADNFAVVTRVHCLVLAYSAMTESQALMQMLFKLSLCNVCISQDCVLAREVLFDPYISQEADSILFV